MLTIWVLTDGKRGHENQSLGLAEALARKTPTRLHIIPVAGNWTHAINWLLGRFPPGLDNPRPDLILAAGHDTHWALLAARRACGGKAIVLMKPSLPLAWFDQVILPSHDVTKADGPLLETDGPINRIHRPPADAPRALNLMLIGGPSPHFSWDTPAVIRQVRQLADATPGQHWTLTTSRRTPADFPPALASSLPGNVGLMAQTETDPDWLPAQLIQAQTAWVTPDSVSMIYEALTAGAGVGLFALEERPTRVSRSILDLAQQGRVLPYAKWEDSPSPPQPVAEFNEANRVAAVILEWLNPGRVDTNFTPALLRESDECKARCAGKGHPLPSAATPQTRFPAATLRDGADLGASLCRKPLAVDSTAARLASRAASQIDPVADAKLASTRPALTVLQMLPALQSGGVERGTLEIAAALVAAGHRAMVMSAGGRMVEELQALGVQHFTWPIGNKSLLALRLVRSLRRFLLEQQVDILHVRSRFPAWIAYLAWRGMDPASRPRFLTTVHGLYSVNAYSRIMTRGEMIIAVSETIRDYLLQHYSDIPAERVTVIHRGVSGADYPYGYQPDAAWRTAFYRQFPEAGGKQLLTLPGRITRLKGHEVFIEILARLVLEGRPIHGLIVGGASTSKQRYLDELREKAQAMGLAPHLTFTGQRQDLKDILAISRLVLSLSTQPESFGRTTLEALRLGIPVAGYNHGGVGEILRSVYPAGCLPLLDRDAVLARIRGLLDAAPEVPPEEFFPLSAMLEKTLEVYTRLAHGRAQTKQDDLKHS